MVQGGNQFDPFSTSPSDWGLTGDVLVGESPSNTAGSLNGDITVYNQFYLAYQKGWSGVMPWADKDGNYDEIDKGLRCEKNNWNMCAPSSSTISQADE